MIINFLTLQYPRVFLKVVLQTRLVVCAAATDYERGRSTLDYVFA